MYRVNCSKKIILVLVSASNSEVDYAVVKKQKVIEWGRCTLDGLIEVKKKYKVKYARVGVFSELTYINKVNITLRNKKLLDIVVRRYISDQSIFMEDFKAKSKVIEREGEKAEVGIVALPVGDLRIMSRIKDTFFVEYIFPVEVTLIAYARRINRNVKSIYWIFDNRLLSLELDRNFVTSRSITNYEEGDENFVSNRENVLVFNSLSSNPDEGLAHLLGLLYGSRKFDFSSADYVHERLACDLAGVALAFSVVLSFLFSAYGVDRYLYLKRLNYKFDSKLAVLNSLEQQINNKNLTNNEKQALYTLSKYQNDSLNELDLGKFLNWLTNIVPKGARLVALEVKREKPNGQGYQNSQPQTSPQAEQLSSKFKVSVQLSINADYSTSKQLVVAFLNELSRRVKPQNNEFSYDKGKESGKFTTTFKIDGEEF